MQVPVKLQDMCNVVSYPVLSSRYVAVRERNMLRRRWKRRVELNNGTSIEDAEESERKYRSKTEC